MSKYTPGPWKTDLRISSPAGRVAIEPDIAIVYAQPGRYNAEASKERLANARLIAAAPDLLAALRKIAYEPIGHPEASDNEILNECAEIARAAIAKATGTT